MAGQEGTCESPKIAQKVNNPRARSESVIFPAGITRWLRPIAVPYLIGGNSSGPNWEISIRTYATTVAMQGRVRSGCALPAIWRTKRRRAPISQHLALWFRGWLLCHKAGTPIAYRNDAAFSPPWQPWRPWRPWRRPIAKDVRERVKLSGGNCSRFRTAPWVPPPGVRKVRDRNLSAGAAPLRRGFQRAPFLLTMQMSRPAGAKFLACLAPFGQGFTAVRG